MDERFLSFTSICARAYTYIRARSHAYLTPLTHKNVFSQYTVSPPNSERDYAFTDDLIDAIASIDKVDPALLLMVVVTTITVVVAVVVHVLLRRGLSSWL